MKSHNLFILSYLRHLRWNLFADRSTTAALVVVAGWLGCVELVDSDVWWHLASGRWVVANRAVPRLDPFSFASADRPWIDLHWGFQVLLWLSYRLGGVAGVIGCAAAGYATAVAVAATARRRGWPGWATLACWPPALLLMSWRFEPRPEVLSLVLVALFLAILLHAEDRPAALAALPILQVAWVNVHGLFVLGPTLVGCFAIDRLARGRSLAAVATAAPVVAACLVNPYGIRGAMLPLELLPKITASGGPYKAEIAEFMGPREFVERWSAPVAANVPYLWAFVFLLLILPLSFLLPATWRLWERTRGDRPARPGAWAFGVVLAVAMAIVGALGLPGKGMPAGRIEAGRMMPIAAVVVGAGAAIALGTGDRRAARLALAGSLAFAAWSAWLRGHLFGPEPGPSAWLDAAGLAGPVVVAAAGVAAAVMTLRAGASLFRLLVATAFGVLGLLAVRNANLLGLVGGTVLAWNFGEWAGRLAEGRTARGGAWLAASWTVRFGLLGVLGFWMVALATGRFFPAIGESRRTGLREQPLTYAHDAARFAARPGLPGRALVYGLRQASVYVFHDGPDRKVFMDGRLEVPDVATFERYGRIDRWLNEADPRGVEALGRLGDPLVLLEHASAFRAEAVLFGRPDWPCVEFDAVAAVFVSRRRVDPARFPEVDFAARLFAPKTLPIDPEAALAEAAALDGIATTWRRADEPPWRRRAPMLLLAARRCLEALSARPGDPRGAALLDRCRSHLAAELGYDSSRDVDRIDALLRRSLLESELGRSAEALDACRVALRLDPEGSRRAPLEGIEAMIRRSTR
ncbi:MAG TPA: hypothetical protein VG406_21270 [Isosphaeraceae bacterium]|jgi:hypothetical protein|nr:hypothetical protein [Isosphaeraceae bacterium]